MNYKRVYYEIIFNRLENKLDGSGYSENHHILPRCLGGDDSKSNLVRLTAREHFLCHLLLTKIYNNKSDPYHYKILKAFSMMFSYSGNNLRYFKINSKIYQRFKIAQKQSQMGSKNSQYGSRWANNNIINIKLKPNESLPNGFVYGKIKKEKVFKLVLQRESNIKLYTKYYETYKDNGFKKFVELTGYNKSIQNLVTMLAKYVEDFVPQNGKPRCKS